jgi:hypothetical protein
VDGCEILHQLIDGLSHYLWGFNHPFGGAGFRWPIHSIIKISPKQKPNNIGFMQVFFITKTELPSGYLT